jgi:hypothetical protein
VGQCNASEQDGKQMLTFNGIEISCLEPDVSSPHRRIVFLQDRSIVVLPSSPMSFTFSNLIFSSRPTHTPRSAHSTETSTRSRKIMFLGSRELPVRWSDNLVAICEPIV